MQKLQRDNEDLKSKLSAAKEEMIHMFARREAEQAENCAALSNLREHQDYLMRVIDDKNRGLEHLDTLVKTQENVMSDLKKKLADSQTQSETYLSQITTMLLERTKMLEERDQLW
jgi:Mg2+ and Co2+ transporter CorA